MHLRRGFDADKSIETLQVCAGRKRGGVGWGHRVCVVGCSSGHVLPQAYSDCVPDHTPSQLHAQMLTNIENKLEEYLGAVDSMPMEFVETSEKSREKERRKV